ncbi:MAG: ABC transporter ATP-binding protein [Clostridiales bacterium]|nr:ABC transporter ATP-binding protein [Clostridiales bacterium]
MNTLLQYLKPHKGAMILTVSVKFFATMMDLIIPSILAKIIDDAVPKNEPRLIYQWGAVMILCAVLSIISNIFANRNAAVTSGKITQKLRHDLFSRVSYLSAQQLDGLTQSSAVSRLTSDTYYINQFLNRTQRMGVRAPLLLIGGLIMTLTLDFRLTLVLVFTLPFISIIVYQITKKSIPIYRKQQRVLDDLIRVMQENIAGVRIIKALSKTQHEQERFDKVNVRLADTGQKARRISALSSPLTSVTLNLGLTLVILAGAYMVHQGLSTTGTIIAFLNYFTLISMAMMGITRIFIMFSRGLSSAGRVAEILQLPEDLKTIKQDHPLSTDKYLSFEEVSFSYSNIDDNLKDIHFSLARGETMGIIGATGSGKTTLINLMLRLYDANKGRIFIKGRDIKTMSTEDLRSSVGVVFQNDFIIAGTIRDNIRYYRDISDEHIWQAVQDAQAAPFIRETGEGLDYRVAQKGNNLSGGQKQRILIARALAGKPELLIFDDSSSALDYRTDAALRKALKKNYQDTTTIIIAQRVSSIMGTDHIMVLEDGRQIGYGRHEELLKSNPVYRDIASTQMGVEGGALID